MMLSKTRRASMALIFIMANSFANAATLGVDNGWSPSTQSDQYEDNLALVQLRTPSLRTYIFGHSLINHATDTDQTTVPYWMDAFAEVAGFRYAVSGQFGQLEKHVENLPPTASWPWRFDGVTQAWNHNNQSFAQADFDSVLITPANYIQTFSPTERFHQLPESAVGFTLQIIDYAVAQEPGIDIFIYENWPNMRWVIDDNVFPATPAELQDYHELTMGTFATWFDDYHAALVEARPRVNIETIPVGPIIAKLMTTTDLSGMPITALYEDIAPHGTVTLYFLASIVTYTAMYGTTPPENFAVPSSVHPLVAANYREILQMVARELQI